MLPAGPTSKPVTYGNDPALIIIIGREERAEVLISPIWSWQVDGRGVFRHIVDDPTTLLYMHELALFGRSSVAHRENLGCSRAKEAMSEGTSLSVAH